MFHAVDPDDQMFCHNIKLSNGRLTAVSFARQIKPEWEGILSPYEAFTREQDKELVFERVRAISYPNCPSRLGAIYLFPNRDAADRANKVWWMNKRVILPAKVVVSYRMGTFDAKLLDARHVDWEAGASQYWSGVMTEDASPEVLLDGVAQLEEWEPYGRLFGMAPNKEI